MIGLPDIKAMAKALRTALAERGVTTTHSECLDLVSRQLGYPNWNTARASAESGGAPALHLPEGWITSGSNAARYRMGADPEIAGAAIIESIAEGDGFGTLMQSIVAEPFAGGRVRFKASLKTRDVSGSAAIWLRVDGERGRMLGFDNLHYRGAEGALSGTHDWTSRRIVLDVPAEAQSIHYGFLLSGNGAVWARDFRIEAAGDGDAVTRGRPYLDGPTNLDFSRRLDG